MNPATRTITAVIVTLLAFAGFEHGLFEALQGRRPTPGLGIQAIGADMQWWQHGGEDAVTILPSFLAAGLAVMGLSVLVVIWAWCFVARRHGVLVLLALLVALTLAGGGMGFVPFYLVTCAYATRIGKPLAWWRRVLPEGLRRALAPLWPYTLAVCVVFWLLAIEIAIFGWFPGLQDPEVLLYTCWSFLLVTMIGLNFTYIAGFAADLGRR